MSPGWGRRGGPPHTELQPRHQTSAPLLRSPEPLLRVHLSNLDGHLVISTLFFSNLNY